MTPEQTGLMEAAKNAALKAHAPYSKFRVGAAVLTDKGIFTGANIENASTNLGICAERVAISHARMNDGRDIMGIAVCCLDAPRDENGNIPVHIASPCGGCRQWIAELAPKAWIVIHGSDKVFTLEDLLPNAFVFNP